MPPYAKWRTEQTQPYGYHDKTCFGVHNMTITSRCNHPGPLAKLIPTRSISSLFARLLGKR